MLVSKIDLPQVDQLLAQRDNVQALAQAVSEHRTHDYQAVVDEINHPQFDTIVNQILIADWQHSQSQFNLAMADYETVVDVLSQYQHQISKTAREYERLALIERHRKLFESHQHNDEH